MADTVMTAVASALAAKAADAVFEGGRSAWAALVRLVRDRFDGDEAAAAALEAAREQPADQRRVRELAAALERVAAVDPAFAAEVRALWPRASAGLPARDGGTVNVSTGTVGGHLIQARDLRVDGGLHLGEVHGPAEP